MDLDPDRRPTAGSQERAARRTRPAAARSGDIEAELGGPGRRATSFDLGAMARSNLSERIALAVYLSCFLWGTLAHIIDLARSGWLSVRDAPLGFNLFWSLLTILDPSAVLLLIYRRRLGLALAAGIMVLDVAVNSYVVYALSISTVPGTCRFSSSRCSADLSWVRLRFSGAQRPRPPEQPFPHGTRKKRTGRSEPAPEALKRALRPDPNGETQAVRVLGVALN